MARRLFYFRPGEEARMLARLEFGCDESGKCEAILTYPIAGMPWRRNVWRSFDFQIGREAAKLLLSEVARIRAEHPSECLESKECWNDTLEKGNHIARDRQSGTLCYSVAIERDDGGFDDQYLIKENFEGFVNSALYVTVADLVARHERLST